ncbi:YheC/YheD family protein [Paenibacillus radicis (ex Xue et al. 2023)]|uniref:YheC/YheD family protein n=1 Tax=Paenibacillus radicis (ex Xue et al. 2023) TaxID=2972489 RepID=A0ABT1YJS8_9BACL|nr:YheC/YheD family protein [Paenibacillus radicis (ex Xue et al. 2023)]MCR8633222.1 YheC/YheD family protein [Paenibacillus radicis (ex Xue et al. 2023)]
MRTIKGKVFIKSKDKVKVKVSGKAPGSGIGKAQGYVISKWKKTKVLLKKPEMRMYIPDTMKLSRASLRELLGKYKMVYIKPDKGTYGNGVMKVEMTSIGSEGDGESFRYQNGLDVRSFTNFEDLYNSILKRTKNRLYLVQKGINLTKYRNRRFDIRVMVQQTPQKKWETTGVIGRVGDPRKVVTNVHNGGKLKPIETLLSPYLTGNEKRKYIARLNALGLKTAHQLHSRFRRLKEIGLDVALDERLHPWVLEVNTCPDPYIFCKLKDKRIFRKIHRYAKAYGRF